MANIPLDTEQLKALFSGDDPMRVLLEAVQGKVLDAEMSEHLGAQRYARTEKRQAYRNGYRPRKLTTRVGTLTLRRVPRRIVFDRTV